MLFKIKEGFYIDFDQIYLIDKTGLEIKIYVKQETPNFQPFILSSGSKLGKKFLFEVDRYLGIN